MRHGCTYKPFDKRNYSEIKKTRGFTLVEVTVAITVFALVMIAAGGSFISIQQSWQRQKSAIERIQNARWAMGFMSNEIRGGGDFTVVSADRAQFDLPTGEMVWYWRGDAGTYGDSRIIYRGVGAGLGVANGNRQELANFIVDNPSGNAIFRQHPSISNLYIIELTVEKNNKQYTLRSQVSPRN